MNHITKAAQESHHKILQLKRDATRSFILLGEELKRNKDKQYFERLGYSTFEAYIESPTISLRRIATKIM